METEAGTQPATAPGDCDIAYQQLFRYAEDMGRLVRERAWAMAELQRARRETLFRLAVTAEFNAIDAPAAMLRIGILSALLAHALGMPEDYCDLLCIAAPLRDIGKIGVRGDGGAGGERVYASPREHPVIGAAILGGSFSEELRMAEDVALTHHERYDGSGYPAGLAGRDIPLSGRIVAVAEQLDRLLAGGGEALLMDEVLAWLRHAAGSAFDPRVVDAALGCAVLHERIMLAVEVSLETEQGYAFAERLPGMWRLFVSSPAG